MKDRMRKIKWPRIYKPYLDMYLSLGFAYLQTVVMNQEVGRDAYTYIGLRWKFFKWDGQFRLYRPGYDYKRRNYER
jgi:hypothetical protein